MEAYPGGVYAKLARRWRDELIASDDASYERARSSGTVESYGEYLRSYPAGRHVAEARGAAAEAERLALEHEPGRVFRDCDACPEMIVVPAGSFMMGSPSSEEGSRRRRRAGSPGDDPGGVRGGEVRGDVFGMGGLRGRGRVRWSPAW